MKAYYRWYKFDKDNDLVEVTKDLFPENDPYINPENGWTILPNTKLEIKEDKKDGKKR